MTCYQRHLGPLFDSLELPYDEPHRRKLDAAIRAACGLPDSAHCPEVWAAVKREQVEAGAEFVERLREQLTRQ